ncbi:hypothetical protein [Halosimplex halobium]
MAEVTELTGERGRTYVCRTCEVEFVIPRDETAVCCPICRMNRIRAVD